MSTTTTPGSFHVRNLDLAELGKKRVEWAYQGMKVLQLVRKEFIKNQPLKGVRLSACLHVTSETANLLITLRDGGAEVALCGSNPLSTQDDIAAVLVRDYGIPVFAMNGEDEQTRQQHLSGVLDHRPTLILDEDADLLNTVLTRRTDVLEGIIGGTEAGARGVSRLRAMARQAALSCPMIALNKAETRQLFDNLYGSGQSTIDGILRATNFLLAGSRFVVVGYGWCGRGVARQARGLGAEVIVTEVNPTRALEAIMDGHRVMSMQEAAKIGDIFCTVTGNKSVLRREHFDRMKDGAILANAGHSDVEIDIPTLEKMANSKRTTRPYVQEYCLRDGRKINLLGEGRLINLACAEGHPAAVMDIAFADQALALEYLVKNAANMEKRVYSVPDELDERVARLKLESLGVKIDRLTPEQEEYLAGWGEGV